jgi:hypothetical protein
MLLSTKDLEIFGLVANEAMPDTATIVRTTEISDGSGGTIPDIVVTAIVKCRISPQGISYSERERPQGEQTFQAWYLTVPIGTDIAYKDIVNVRNGKIVEVLGFDKDRSYGVSLRASVGEISG